jgi:succinate dehydrogenase / fumarate reductase, cytochrome b subunit
MEYKNNPLTPHLQIYRWQISSLLSIAHRIVGVINIIAISLICIWVISLSISESSHELMNFFMKSFFGKFFALGLSWTFSFHILNEIRHLSWDLGFGFDLKVSTITGYLSIIGSFVFAIIIFLIGKHVI